ncbi:hypothetical protein BDC45DRAFT_521769, partial [Circinella umbellata]
MQELDNTYLVTFSSLFARISYSIYGALIGPWFLRKNLFSLSMLLHRPSMPFILTLSYSLFFFSLPISFISTFPDITKKKYFYITAPFPFCFNYNFSLVLLSLAATLTSLLLNMLL